MIREEPLGRNRRRRLAEGETSSLDPLPDDRRQLLRLWVKRGGDSRWETLKKDAGIGRQALADNLLEWLLANGWVALDERFERAAWWPIRVQFRKLDRLRETLGIENAATLNSQWAASRASLPPESPLADALDRLPAKTALARADLAHALYGWQAEGRSGTQRDFALFARGTTKSITPAEWAWLAAEIDLAEYGIERHTPTLLLASSMSLEFDSQPWPLAAAADFAALTPATLTRVKRIGQPPREWLLVENRTSFEREARSRAADTAVVWLPGHPPTWWRDAVRRLLALAPAPARIACDPDPAGIEIALAASRVWDDAGLAWTPWKMDGESLAALPARQPLNDWDRSRIVALRGLQGLPAPLVDLLAEMEKRGEKGEQEGLRPDQPSATTASTSSP
jgi:hypothetical protein